jgi:hypothetical protein
VGKVDPILWTKMGLVFVFVLCPMPVPWGEKGPAAAHFV